MPTPVVAVVGGGVAGLAAAWELLQGNDVRVIVLDAADAVGGKLRRAEVAGHSVDVGAESMLARRPEATGLVADLGLGRRLTHPEPGPGGGVEPRTSMAPTGRDGDGRTHRSGRRGRTPHAGGGRPGVG